MFKIPVILHYNLFLFYKHLFLIQIGFRPIKYKIYY